MKIEGLNEFIRELNRIDSELHREAVKWLDSLGMMFLEEVQREIIRTETVDTRRLLNSFTRGDSGNVWKMTHNGLTLEVGTNVEYAKFVNDGHFTLDPAKTGGRDWRWVPGVWVGDRFEYQKGAKTGMMLKYKWVDGSAYFDTANRIFKAMFRRSIDKKFAQFIASRGGGRRR